MIGVNLDANLARAEKFARSQDVQFPVADRRRPRAPAATITVDRVPMMVFVDRAGVLRAAHREFKARDEALYVRELRTS